MEEIIIKGLEEKLYYEKLDNGLPVYMLVNDKVNNFYITFNVKYGSVDTEFKPKGEKKFIKVHDGTAHFLEHLKFNEDDGVTAHDYFNKIGSSINAFTTFHFTSYEVFASEEFEKNLTHLLDYVQKPYFTDELVEKEKGIIVEEVKMGKNNPGHKLYYGMNKALYKNDKRRNLVTGEVEDVKAINKKEIELIFDTFYHPENMFVVITGNFNPYEAIGIIKENQNKKEFIPYKKPIRKIAKECSGVNEKYKEIECNVEIPKVKIDYKMNKEIFGGLDEEIGTIYLNIILRNNFGNTSLLKEELMEKELVTSIGAGAELFQDIVTIDITLETKYPNEVIPIIKNKMENLVLSEEDLKRRIRANIAALINDYDDIEYVNSDISDQLVMFGRVRDNYYDVYNSLNMEEANSILKNINLDSTSTVVLIPIKK